MKATLADPETLTPFPIFHQSRGQVPVGVVKSQSSSVFIRSPELKGRPAAKPDLGKEARGLYVESRPGTSWAYSLPASHQRMLCSWRMRLNAGSTC